MAFKICGYPWLYLFFIAWYIKQPSHVVSSSGVALSREMRNEKWAMSNERCVFPHISCIYTPKNAPPLWLRCSEADTTRSPRYIRMHSPVVRGLCFMFVNALLYLPAQGECCFWASVVYVLVKVWHSKWYCVEAQIQSRTVYLLAPVVLLSCVLWVLGQLQSATPHPSILLPSPTCCLKASKFCVTEPIKACYEQKENTIRNCRIHAYMWVRIRLSLRSTC